MAADHAILAEEALDDREQRAIRRHLAPIRREWAWMKLIDAVKARDIKAALAAFASPPDVALSLGRRLAEQMVVRTARKLHLGSRGEDRQ